MKMACILLGGLSAVCAVGWFVSRLTVNVLLCFMEEKRYTPPTGVELKACSRKAVERMFKRSSKNMH
jgi:hypothetical protein